MNTVSQIKSGLLSLLVENKQLSAKWRNIVHNEPINSYCIKYVHKNIYKTLDKRSFYFAS